MARDTAYRPLIGILAPDGRPASADMFRQSVFRRLEVLRVNGFPNCFQFIPAVVQQTEEFFIVDSRAF